MSTADPWERLKSSFSYSHWLRSWPRRYGFALLVVVAATLARFAIGAAFGLFPPFVLFFPAIILVALLAGFGPGVFATLLSAVSVACFFWTALNVFGTNRLRDIVGLGLFSCIGTAFSRLADRYRRREARLQEFERVVQGLEEMIAVVDRDYRYVIANPAFLKYRGMKNEQVIGHRVSEIMNPGVFEPTVKGKLEECFQGKAVQYELRYRYPSLGERDLFISYFPIGGPRGVDRVACVLQDVTEKRRAAQDLRASEDRYRERVEHSEDLVCRHDLEGKLLWVNPPAGRILGYEVAELLNIPMRELIAPQFREQFDEYLRRIEASGVDKGLLCVVTRGGERRIWEYNNTLRTEGVASPIVRGMAHDVTERKRAEAALRRREEDYRQFVARSSEGIFREDLTAPVPTDLPEEEMISRIRFDSYVTECNDALAKMYGFGSAQEIIGRRLGDMLVPGDPSNLELLREYIRGGFRVLERPSHEVDKEGNAKVFLNSMIGIVEKGMLVRTWGIQREVTEQVKLEEARTRAEEAMRASEAHFRILVEQASDAIGIADMNGRWIDVNSAWTGMLGYSREEILKQEVDANLTAEEKPRLASELARLQGGETTRTEWKVRRKDGTFLPLEVSMKRLPDGRLQVIARDVTERKRAEEALRESEERFRSLYENATIGLYRTTPDGKILLANPSLVKMLGFNSFSELSQRNLEEEGFEPGYERAEFQRRLANEGEVRGLEASWTRTDGTAVFVRESAKAIRDAEGKPAYYEGTVEDITERKRAEEAVRKSEERFRVALKGSPITVFNQDLNLRHTWVYNPNLYWQKEIIGKTDEEIIGAEAARPLTELKRRVLKTGVGERRDVVIRHNGRNYSVDLTIEPLRDGGGNVIGITGSSMDIARLRELADSLQTAKDRLVQEKQYLESEIRAEIGFEEIIGCSPALLEVLKNARVVAPTDSSVLLLGETGTGKELVARAVHSLSDRHERNFIKLNCAAVPTGLLESELFGHEKGAFTGAVNQKVGRIELADKGTLFLDEIGELPPELQPKLLRVLQDREFERMGGVHTLRVDVRIIAATNRDLEQDVANKRFREDLFYRLNVFPIRLPALRQRRSDIPALVDHFMRKHAGRMGKQIEIIPDETMDILQNWSWPGNIRELENMIERMVILTTDRVLAPPPMELDEPRVSLDDNLTEVEREHIIRVLHETGGVLSGADGAASRLGVKRTTLQSMLKRFGIEPQEFRRGTGTFGRE